MRARFHVPRYRLDRGRYRPVGDPQAALERWWTELGRALHHEVCVPAAPAAASAPPGRAGQGGTP
jgi:hypothetical protein